MPLRVIGAGLGRTGTNSLKLAAVWGEPVDWNALLADFAATVDWPACALWRELSAANPGALVLLSTRESQAWWGSFESTILPTLSRPVPPGDAEWVERRAMTLAMMELRFDSAWRDRDSAIAAYESHNDAVRSEVPAAKLVDWQPGDGWEPICAALDLLLPAEPFPHVNTARTSNPATNRNEAALPAAALAPKPGDTAAEGEDVDGVIPRRFRRSYSGGVIAIPPGIARARD